MSPTISIIMATYNRSNILGMVIETVRWQTFTDWELIIVGDACTDDTADVIARFNDPRIRFVNLEQNVGEQSGPNNHGCSLARGQYLAFLNHDDFWLPDHLAAALEHLKKIDADLVFSQIEVINPDGKRWIQGRSWCGYYDSSFEALASSWVFRRSLLDRVGPWRSYRKCYPAPSQDWIIRAWQKKARLIAWPYISVVAIQSGNRKGSYAQRQEAEHREFFARLKADPAAFRAEELKLLAKELATPPLQPSLRKRIMIKLYLHGPTVRQLLRLRFRRGKLIDSLRKTRGLPPLR